jgi:putative hydrolases of HD superfamily
MSEPDLSGVVAFLGEAGHLKRVPRAGWLVAGIHAPESVAEHSFRTAVIALVLAHLEGADPLRAATLALVHDLPETRIGDVPAVGRGYVTTAAPEQVAADQTSGLPPTLAGLITGLIGEFEAKDTPEAQCAKDADKLECLLQAREYEAAGNLQLTPWVDTSRAALRTVSGRRLADLTVTMEPGAWWAEATAAYPRTVRPRALP